MTSPAGAVPKFMSIWRVPKPVIAQVHGWCVGGGSDMALCADLVYRQRGRAHRHAVRAHVGRLPDRHVDLPARPDAREGARAERPAAVGRARRPRSGLINRAVPFERLEARGARRGGAAGAAAAVPARGDEAGRQPGVREHGPRLHADARPDPRRADAQHAGRAALHRAGRAGGRAGGRRASATGRSATTARRRRTSSPTPQTSSKSRSRKVASIADDEGER